MKYIRNFFIKIQLLYYTFMDFVEDELRNSGSLKLDTQVIEREHQNAKLMQGVRKLVRRLRAMNPADRTKPDNLLCTEPYKKSRKEKMDELRARDKVNRNPILKTEDDLVSTVVKKAPMYAKEQEIAEVRKAITACLRRSAQDPTNPLHTKEAAALKAKLRLLRGEIERMKRND